MVSVVCVVCVVCVVNAKCRARRDGGDSLTGTAAQTTYIADKFAKVSNEYETLAK